MVKSKLVKMSDSDSNTAKPVDRLKLYVTYGLPTVVLLFVIDILLSMFISASKAGSIIIPLVELLFYAAVIFVFVNSIRHLMRYEEKGYAITSLVITGFILLLLIIVSVVTAMLTLSKL